MSRVYPSGRDCQVRVREFECRVCQGILANAAVAELARVPTRGGISEFCDIHAAAPWDGALFCRMGFQTRLSRFSKNRGLIDAVWTGRSVRRWLISISLRLSDERI